MTVVYPTALHGANPPGALTLGRETYRIDRESGIIDCPAEAEAAVAEHLAAQYDVDVADITVETDGDSTVPDHTSVDTVPEHTRLDDLTKDELYEAATEAGIDGRSSMTKPELIDALKEA